MNRSFVIEVTLKIGAIFAISWMSNGLTGCESKSGASTQPPEMAKSSPTLESTQKVTTDRTSAAVESQPPETAKSTLTLEPKVATTQQLPAIVQLAPPKVIFVGIDKSKSVETSKIPNLEPVQVRYLAEEAAKRGVEVRIGDVCTDSDRSLRRIYIPEPPAKLDIPKPQEPTVKDVDNPLHLPKAKAEYQKQLKIYEQREATYTKEVLDRDRLVKQKIDTFITSVKELSNKPAKCGATDIIGLMKRADLYLSEPTPNWKQLPHKIALLITDGEETVKTNPKPIEWKSQAEIVLVSSGGKAGLLQPLLGSSQPFESIDGAISYILSR